MEFSFPPRQIRTERVAGPGLPSLAPAGWDALVEQDGGASLQPFSTWAWVASHVEHRLPAGERASCHLAWDGDRLIGVLPLLRRGARLRVPADFHTRDGVPILAPRREVEALGALLESVRATEGRFRVLSAGGILEGSPVFGALEQAASGPAFHAPDLAGRCLRIAGTWSDYKSSLSRNFQRNLGKARRRAHREGAETRFLVKEAADPGLIDRFVELESGGWKGREGDPIAASASTTAFYRAATQRLAASGWLEWHLLEIDGRLAAAHLAARIGERRTLLRIAYDESFSRLAPGNLLLAALLERTFELGDAKVVDCITDMPWHENWNLERYGYEEAWLYPHRLAAFPRWAKGVTQRLLRRGGPPRHGE